MSIYDEFLDDAKEIIEDLGVPGQTADGSLTWTVNWSLSSGTAAAWT